MAVFKSTKQREDNLAADPANPAPNSYNLSEFNSIAKKPLQGGAPNNVLNL